MEKIEAWRTTDGLVFDDETAASKHEATLEMGEALQQDPDWIYGELRLTSPGELKDFLARHEDIIARMMGWAEPKRGQP